jgi:hypothetical protein
MTGRRWSGVRLFRYLRSCCHSSGVGSEQTEQSDGAGDDNEARPSPWLVALRIAMPGKWLALIWLCGGFE